MHQSENSFSITAKDILETIRKHKKVIYFWTCAIPVITLLCVLVRPATYKADATFREKGKAQNDSTRSGLNLAVLAGLNDNNENTALSLFKSRSLLGNAIVKKNRQAIISNDGVELSWLKNFYRNLQTEYALLLEKPYPFLGENDNSIEIRSLDFAGEKALKLRLHFLNDHTFQITLPNQEKLQGEIEKPIVHDLFRLTIAPNERTSLAGTSFTVTLNPLSVVYKKIANKLTIQSDNKDKGLIKLSFKDPNRKEAASFLNTLLSTYQEHQRKEHERICKEQIAYLHDRQKEAGLFLEEMMLKHAQTMSLQGPTIDLLFQNQQGYLQKLLAIDLELHRLQSALKEGRVFYDSLGWEGGAPTVINQLLGEVRGYRQHAESIQMALRNQVPPKGGNKRAGTQKEYQGIDLASANQLFLEYSARLNETEGEINHHQFLAEQVQTPDFEVSSLSTVLKDPVSHEIIQKAANANMLLQDQVNRSAREQERLKNELSLHKAVLKTHIEQTKELLLLKKSLLQDKIWGLQNTQLDLIAQKIAVVEQQLQDYIRTRINNLEQERGVIEEQQLILRQEMVKLPSKWASEKMIEQHLETTKKMIEKIAEAVEAKNISAKLDLSQSSPLDQAIVPMHPQSPLTLLFVVLGAFVGFSFSTVALLAKEAIKGFPAREDNLKLKGESYLGKINAKLAEILSDNDLETLRHVASQLANAKCSVLFINQGPNYAHYIAELLAKGGKKVTIISCIFDGKEETDQAHGLLQYLQGEEIQMKNRLISSGGVTRFGKENLESPRFAELLTRLKKECDCVLLISRAPLCSAEAETISCFVEKNVVTLQGERLPALEAILNREFLFIECCT